MADFQQNPYFNQTPSPFGSTPGGFGGGNPANRGFAPQASISTGAGAIADMVISMLLSSITQKMGGHLPSFGRPQVSDYADRMMKDREQTSYRMMSGIYGSSPSSKLFGKLGDNFISQQLGDMFFQSGGSRGEAFKQVFGRFGNQLGGGGPGGMPVGALAAAQVVHNMDQKFTDRGTGNWRYGDTAGFNRKNTINAVAEFTSQFGGKDLINQMANTGHTKSGKEGIDSASKEITEITKAVREAGNFFGPNMPFDQLMQEMKVLTDSAKNVKVADIKGSLQQVQGMAAAVDMSNEAFSNYMKVVGEIKKASGGTGSTKDLAIESMKMGKAIADTGMKEAHDKGVAYSGPNQVEAAMEVSRMVENRKAGGSSTKALAAMKTLQETGNSVLAKKYTELAMGGKPEEADRLLQEAIKNGEVDTEDQAQMQRLAGTLNENPELKKDYDRQVSEWSRKNKISDKRGDATIAAQTQEREYLKSRGVNSKLADQVANGEAWKTVEESTDVGAIVRNTGASVADVRNMINERARGFKDKASMDISAASLTTKNIAESKKNEELAQKHTVAVSAASSAGYIRNSDAGFLERGANVAKGVFEDMQKDGKPMTAERMLKFLKARGKGELLGSGTDKQQLARADMMLKDQQFQARFESEKARLTTEGKLSGDELDKEATKIAGDATYGKDSIQSLEAKKKREYEEKFKKQGEKDGLSGDTLQKYIDDNTEGAVKKDKKDLFGPSEEDDATNTKNKDEDRKDSVTEKLIIAIQENTASHKGLSGKLNESRLGSFLNKIMGGDSSTDQVPNKEQ